MRELQYVQARRLVWRDAAEPRLRLATDAIVGPFLAGRCDGDPLFLQRDAGRLLSWGAALHLCDEAFDSSRSNPFVGPFAYGHECVAEVTACGSGGRRRPWPRVRTRSATCVSSRARATTSVPVPRARRT